MGQQPRRRDPRLFQIAILTGFLVYGTWMLSFDVRPAVAAAILLGALASQSVFSRGFGLTRLDTRSALISGLSLSLLLRTDLLWLGLAAGFNEIRAGMKLPQMTQPVRWWERLWNN